MIYVFNHWRVNKYQVAGFDRRHRLVWAGTFGLARLDRKSIVKRYRKQLAQREAYRATHPWLNHVPRPRVHELMAYSIEDHKNKLVLKTRHGAWR